MTEEQLIDGEIRQINPKSFAGLSRTSERVRRNIFSFIRFENFIQHYLIIKSV